MFLLFANTCYSAVIILALVLWYFFVISSNTEWHQRVKPESHTREWHSENMLERTHKSSIFVTDMIKMYTLGYFQCLSPCSLQAEASLLHLGYNTWLWAMWVMHSSTKGLYFDPSSSSARFCIWHIDNLPPSSKVQGHSYSQRWVSKDKSFSVLWELVCSPSASNSVAKESRLVKFFPQQKTYWLVRKKRSAGWSPFFWGKKCRALV